MIDLWLDDFREPPPGWVWAKTVKEAQHYIELGGVRKLSLDHDLGHDFGPTSYHLCLWMAEWERWPKEKPMVHSQNPVGAAAMRFIIDRHFPRESEMLLFSKCSKCEVISNRSGMGTPVGRWQNWLDGLAHVSIRANCQFSPEAVAFNNQWTLCEVCNASGAPRSEFTVFTNGLRSHAN